MRPRVALVPLLSAAIIGSSAIAGPPYPQSHKYLITLSGSAELASGLNGDMD